MSFSTSGLSGFSLSIGDRRPGAYAAGPNLYPEAAWNPNKNVRPREGDFKRRKGRPGGSALPVELLVGYQSRRPRSPPPPPPREAPSPFGRASFAVIARPRTSWRFRAVIAAWAWFLSGISTKPNPRDLPDILSRMIATEETSPCASKAERRSSSVASYDRLPT